MSARARRSPWFQTPTLVHLRLDPAGAWYRLANRDDCPAFAPDGTVK